MKSRIFSLASLCFVLLLEPIGIGAQSPLNFQYFYDDAGQLSKVVDSSGNVVTHMYDAAGNITNVIRSTAGALSIFNFTVGRAAPGALIVIQGQGFSTNPASNTVMFNGSIATVLSATSTTLTVIVPSGATSGPISITVGSTTVYSDSNFNILMPMAGVTLPTVSFTSPTGGQSVVKGQTIPVILNVTPGSSPVISADIAVNGQFLMNAVAAPFRRTFTVPYGVSSLTFTAKVRDQAGNFGGTSPVTVSVIADPLTTVTGTVQDKTGTAVIGAAVAVKLNGLKAEFFAFGGTLTSLPDLTGLTPGVTKMVSALDFRNPGNLFGSDPFGVVATVGSNFAARFTGNLRVDAPANFTFTLGAQDGAKLIVNSTTVVQLNNPGMFGEAEGTIALNAGTFPIEVDYYAGGGTAQLQLAYRSATATSDAKIIVPPAVLSQPADTFTGTSGTGGAFSFSSVPTALGNFHAFASASGPVSGNSVETTPVGGGTTNTGTTSLHKVIIASLSIHGGAKCMVTTTGVGYCWGSGYLGDGNFYFGGTTPRLVSGSLTWAAISASHDHSCGVTTSGAAYCWGQNTHGELGGNFTDPTPTPVPVSGGLIFASVKAGLNHSCGVTTNGQAYCWGRNGGKLGDGTSVDRNVPTPVSGGLTFATVNPSQFNFTCGLASGGKVYCWGFSNDLGQLGIGSTDSVAHLLPARVTGGQFWIALSSDAGNHSCALTADGGAYCWGENTAGQLGDGSTITRAAPAAINGFTFRDIGAGTGLGAEPSHSCGVSSTGAALCWGGNVRGELGNAASCPNSGTSLVPVTVQGGLTFSRIVAGDGATCALTGGWAFCWGNVASTCSPTPVQVTDPP